MINLKEPITNPALVEAIARYQHDPSQEHSNAMITLMMKAHFLAPVVMNTGKEMPDEEGKITLQQDTKMQFPLLSASDGQQYFMAFTDWAELKKWQDVEQQQTVVFTFDDYAAMILQDGASAIGYVINPYHENMVFSKALIASLKQQKEQMRKGFSHQQINAGETISYGQPKDYPSELVAVLSKQLKKMKQVKAGFLQLMTRGEEKSWLLILDFDGDKEDVFPHIAQAATPYVKGMYIDMVSIHTELGQSASAEIDPFYKKLFYKKPIITPPNIAVVDDIFALQAGGCVVACKIISGEFDEFDPVQVFDEEGHCVGSCVIAGIEQGRERVKSASSKAKGKYGAFFAFMIKEKDKSDFQKGYTLKK